MPVDVITEEPRWEQWGLEQTAETAVAACLKHLGLSPEAFELAVLGCDDARIAVLNADFRGKPAPTNVLSWPVEDLSPAIDGEPCRFRMPKVSPVVKQVDKVVRVVTQPGLINAQLASPALGSNNLLP